jgi:hypothetical protein
MHLEINRVEGLRNDLLLQLDRAEIESVLLSVANRDRLMALPGMPRHRTATPTEIEGVAASKVEIDEHLRRLSILGSGGSVQRRAVAISNRNLGTNHGHVAWQRAETPRIFRIREDPCDYPMHSCLAVWRNGGVSIEDLRFAFSEDRVYRASDKHDLTDEIEWATFGQRVLRGGAVARIDDILDQFYDVRHALAFDHHREEGERTRRALYDGYPASFKANTRRAWQELGVPRARYFHNAIGVGPHGLVVVQREGTAEEIGSALQHAGAAEGIILDNGGSVVCWVWWANQYAGGVVSSTVDYRPPGTSAIGFVLKGPVRTELPGGSVSYTVA